MKKHLSVFPLVLLLCFVVGCRDKAAMAELDEFRAQAETEEEYKALTRSRDEAWLKGDIEALREIALVFWLDQFFGEAPFRTWTNPGGEMQMVLNPGAG